MKGICGNCNVGVDGDGELTVVVVGLKSSLFPDGKRVEWHFFGLDKFNGDVSSTVVK